MASETIKVGQEPPPRAVAQEQAPVAGQPAAQQAAAPPSAEQGLAQLDFEPEVQADSPSAAPASKPADSPDQTAPAPAAEGAPASAVQPAAAPAGAIDEPCTRSSPAPLSSLSPEERFRSFREPLPPTQLWNPSGDKRVGLQAGHWLVNETPPELSRLEGGASGGGKQEWEVNLDIARRTAAILEGEGVQVDILPSTVPQRYRAHAFVSIHADGDTTGALSGFKIARPGFSSVPEADDRLVAALNDAYGAATLLRRDDEHISMRMRYYYAFNSRRYCHAVAPGVPQAIVETGFLTNAGDRVLLIGNPDLAARGIARGILDFLRQL